MYISSNGPYMGAGMGPIQEQQWAIYARMHAPLILSYMAHVCSVGKKILKLKYYSSIIRVFI